MVGVMAKRISTSGIGMKRRNSPGRVAARPTVVADDARKPLCEAKCERRATVFRKWRWWCDDHDPGNVPAPGCKHEDPSPCFGISTCSYCGYQPDQETS